MTSNNFIKAGLGAALAFGLVAAPLAISPALATSGTESGGTTVATSPEVTPTNEGSTAELTPSGSLPDAVTQAGTLASPNVIIN